MTADEFPLTTRIGLQKHAVLRITMFFNAHLDPVPKPRFGWPKIYLKNSAGKKNIFLVDKLHFTVLVLGPHNYRRSLQASKVELPVHIQNRDQLTGNTAQTRTSSTSKPEIYFLFSISEGHFCPAGSGSSRPKYMRIRIRNTVTGISLCMYDKKYLGTFYEITENHIWNTSRWERKNLATVGTGT